MLVKEESSAKKQQWLYLNSIRVKYGLGEVGRSESVVIHCHGITRETPRLPILNNLLEFTEQLAFPVRFTEMVTLEVRSHDHAKVLDNRYASLYFMVENIRRGEHSELRLPLSLRNSNKVIGEIIINYYLENIHLPNTELTVDLDKKTERVSTPSTNYHSKSLEDQLMQDPLTEVENLLELLHTSRTHEIKYAMKYACRYVETRECTNSEWDLARTANSPSAAEFLLFSATLASVHAFIS